MFGTLAWYWYGVALAAGGILGGLPTGRLVAVLFHHPMLATGTANPGPLSWLKIGQPLAAGTTLVLEAGKVIAAMQLLWWLTFNPVLAQLAGLVAVMSHGHPFYARFRPCRTSAALGGLYCGLGPFIGLFAAALWVLTFSIYRRQYLATFAMVAGTLPAAFVLGGNLAAATALGTACYALWQYRQQFLMSLTRKELPWPGQLLPIKH